MWEEKRPSRFEAPSSAVMYHTVGGDNTSALPRAKDACHQSLPHKPWAEAGRPWVLLEFPVSRKGPGAGAEVRIPVPGNPCLDALLLSGRGAASATLAAAPAVD